MLNREIRDRLAKEYRYASIKMEEAELPARKLFYFSVLFSEAQRILNMEWDRELCLVHAIAHHAHSQINSVIQTAPVTQQAVPVAWEAIFKGLTKAMSDISTYFESETGENNGDLLSIVCRIAEIAYASTGNGSYLYEKGMLKI